MRWARRLRLSLGLGIFAALIIGPYNAYWPGAVDFMDTYFELLRQVNNSLTVLPAFLFILLGSWLGAHLVASVDHRHHLRCYFYIGKPNLFSRHGFGPHCFRAGKNICPTLPTPHICQSALCTLASPLIFSAAYQGKWVANYAPQTFAERGAGEVREWIYHVYAEEAANKPLFGHGINGTKDFKPADLEAYIAQTSDTPDLQNILRTDTQSGAVAAHAHNLFLQLIFEFGYVGALLVLAAVWRFCMAG